MKKLWNMVANTKFENSFKNKLYIALFMLISAFAGAIAWFLLGRFLLDDTKWLICFMGYPAVFVGFFGGSIYLYKNEFDIY